MAKAIAPSAMPPVPDDMSGWRRSTRRGSVYHLHFMGQTPCGRALDRHKSETSSNLGDLQYWGVCPRCMRHAEKAS